MTLSEFSSVYLDIEKQIYSSDEEALVDSAVGHPERIDGQSNVQPSSFSHQHLSQQAVPGETQIVINNKYDICTNDECYYPGKYDFIYHISRPIRRAVIFSLEILEKKMMNVF